MIQSFGVAETVQQEKELVAANARSPFWQSGETLFHPSRCVRFGAVSYLNSKPLIEDLQSDLGEYGRLTTDLPSRLADQLYRGEIDVGLIPVIEQFRNNQTRIVSSSAIVCHGPVWSVRLFFRTDPRNVARIAMDEGSRTSVALAKVLFQARTGRVPETIRLAMDADPRRVEADAVLLIGDRAMHPEQFVDVFETNWDLGQVWWEETQLPFVFAAWAAADPMLDAKRIGALLDNVRIRGIQNIPKIAARCATLYQLTETKCIDYLTNYIRFELDEHAIAGLEEFKSRCLELDLLV